MIIAQAHHMLESGYGWLLCNLNWLIRRTHQTKCSLIVLYHHQQISSTRPFHSEFEFLIIYNAHPRTQHTRKERNGTEQNSIGNTDNNGGQFVID